MNEIVEELRETDPAPQTTTQYVTFLIDKISYGVEISFVREIKQWSSITPLPNQKPYTRGVLNLRGTIIPVHDLRARFGGELTETTPQHVVIIVSIAEQIVGILVDAVSDIATVDLTDVRPLPTSSDECQNQCIEGLVPAGDDVIALLNLRELLAPEGQMNEAVG